MKLFGYYLVKTTTLRAHEETLSELIEHFNTNDGMVRDQYSRLSNQYSPILDLSIDCLNLWHGFN